jgi:multidrug resistance efflux pump
MATRDVTIDFDDSSLYSAKLLNSSRSYRAFLYWVCGLLAAAAAALFLPWQQNIQGSGEVTALSPSDRPQTVPSVIGGRIQEWYVREGQYVEKGAPILRIGEVKDEYLDPGTVDRYGEQVRAKEGAIAAKLAKVAALGRQIRWLEEGLSLSLEKARNTVVQSAAAVEAAVADSSIAQDQYLRRERLKNDGLSSLNDLQQAGLRVQQNNAKLVEARNRLLNARIELNSLEADYGDKIAKARADSSATMAEVDEGRAEVSKLRNAYDNLRIRNSFYEIRAPQDGYVVQAVRPGVGEQVSAGSPVVTIQPAAVNQAVALYVRPVDVPLISAGRKVRLQFDGWPALQFSGWPSVSVGTFGGVVAVVDRVSQPDGTFRVLVTPDPGDEPWPEQVRLGSPVLGWAMLDEVSLGFELWRRLNAFPPSIAPPAAGESKGSAPAQGSAPAESKT